MDGVCITISEGDVIVFPFKLFCRSLVQVVDIDERFISYFLDVVALLPTRLLGEMKSTGDRLDLA